MRIKKAGILIIAAAITCTTPAVPAMAADTSESVQEIISDNEIDSLVSDPDKVVDIIMYVKNEAAKQDISDDQISSMDSDELAEIKERLVPFMVSECGRHGVTRVFFMLTNIIEESTELLYYGEGSEEMARIAFHMEPKDGVFDLKGVVSRKKQLIPALMEAAQAGQNDYN